MRPLSCFRLFTTNCENWLRTVSDKNTSNDHWMPQLWYMKRLGKGHFFAAAAEAMRRILINRAREFFAGLSLKDSAASLGLSRGQGDRGRFCNGHMGKPMSIDEGHILWRFLVADSELNVVCRNFNGALPRDSHKVQQC